MKHSIRIRVIGTKYYYVTKSGLQLMCEFVEGNKEYKQLNEPVI